MIYPIKHQITNTKNQEGVTLLLAILILASVLAISFSLTTILFIEIRSSGDLARSEGTLYAATGVGEQALFNLRRQVCPNVGTDAERQACLNGTYTSQFGNSVHLVGNPVLNSASSPTFVDKVVPTYTSLNTTQDKYEFCSNIPQYDSNGKTLGCGYGKVTVTYIHTGTDDKKIYAYLCQFDPNPRQPPYLSAPCTDRTYSDYWISPTEAQLSGITNDSVTWILDKDLQQTLILTSCPISSAGPCTDTNVYFSVTTYGYDSSGNLTTKGLPTQGKSSIIINTANGPVGRKIQVVVPNQ